MILSVLELNNFRNYRRQRIEFAEGRNAIVGRNAQGKSNVLEAVYFLSHLRSPRAPRMRELLTEGETEAAVRGTVIDGEDRINIKAAFGETGRTIEVNARKVSGAARARGVLKCVLFAPDDLYLVKGEPARRRGYFDETMEELGPLSATTVQQYRHVLRQRNALLKRWEISADLRKDLAPWDEALVSAGAEMVAGRLKMVAGIGRRLREAYMAVSGEDSDLEVEYRGALHAGAAEDAGAVEELMRDALAGSAAEEKRARTTLVGPHRDDLEITLGGRGARTSASQGEQRTIAFCLRVAQMRYLEEETGKEPVLLLDDVLSELDGHRRKNLLQLLDRAGQSILTATELPEQIEKSLDRLLLVEGGSVEVG